MHAINVKIAVQTAFVGPNQLGGTMSNVNLIAKLTYKPLLTIYKNIEIKYNCPYNKPIIT